MSSPTLKKHSLHTMEMLREFIEMSMQFIEMPKEFIEMSMEINDMSTKMMNKYNLHSPWHV